MSRRGIKHKRAKTTTNFGYRSRQTLVDVYRESMRTRVAFVGCGEGSASNSALRGANHCSRITDRGQKSVSKMALGTKVEGGASRFRQKANKFDLKVRSYIYKGIPEPSDI